MSLSVLNYAKSAPQYAARQHTPRRRERLLNCVIATGCTWPATALDDIHIAAIQSSVCFSETRQALRDPQLPDDVCEGDGDGRFRIIKLAYAKSQCELSNTLGGIAVATTTRAIWQRSSRSMGIKTEQGLNFEGTS